MDGSSCVRLIAAAGLLMPVASVRADLLSDGVVQIRRTNNRSPAFHVAEGDVGYFMDYTGFAPQENAHGGERFFRGDIGPKVMDMIGAAERHIIMSVFLFDSFYAETDPGRDVVGVLRDAFLRKKRTHPNCRIAIILDPSHKAYGRRESEATRRFRGDGIDVFYSDLLSGLKRASLVGVRESLGHMTRGVDAVTFGGWGTLWSGVFSKARLPADFDGDPVTLETAYNAFLMKANHRKILVTDMAGAGYEALVTSANPHNASAFHVNSAVSVKGVAARYLFNVLREDMRKSVRLGRRYAHWHYAASRPYRKQYFSETFPEMALDDVAATAAPQRPGVAVTVVTEREILNSVLELLNSVAVGDEVRIQMFYLSFMPVLDAILDACGRARVRLLLDANKDSFNRQKDGTPNRQVARHLLREASGRQGNLAVRWYATHGEQNHAKTMSITNPSTGKYVLTTGSCNWTGRNMDGVNMEANVVVSGSRKVAETFNAAFDLFWSNDDGNEYSLAYETFSDQTAPDWKWKKGEKPFYYSTF